MGVSGEVKTESSRKLVVATRNDVEAFERGLRRGRIAGWAGLATLIVVGGAAGGIVWREQQVLSHRARDTEVEPNNTPETATLVAPGGEIRGRIGQRISVDHGDVDFYRLTPLPRGESRIRVELTPQPNIDTDVELLRAGRSTAVAVADDSPAGGREVLAGFRVSGDAQYYLSVHEHLGAITIPMENVTDWYTLRFTVSPVTTDLETEPDDNEEIAQTIAVGSSVRGYIESHDDVDYWCLAAQTGPLQFTLTQPETLDMQVTVHPRDGAAEEIVDQPIGHDHVTETGNIPAPAVGGRPACLIVRGSLHRAADAAGDGDHPYVLEVRAP